jgi:hypothetical protein
MAAADGGQVVDIMALALPQLRELCSASGLPTLGGKAALQDRLLSAKQQHTATSPGADAAAIAMAPHAAAAAGIQIQSVTQNPFADL